MNRARGQLVVSLIDRLNARLHYRTGIDAGDLERDDLFVLTRTTLVDVSKSDIGTTITGLVSILDELLTQFGPVRNSWPNHVLQSELFAIELLADCCTAHWDDIRNTAASEGRNGSDATLAPEDGAAAIAAAAAAQATSGDLIRKTIELRSGGPRRRADPQERTPRSQNVHTIVPEALGDSQVTRLLNLLTRSLTPIPLDYQMPTSTLLDLGSLTTSTDDHSDDDEDRVRGSDKTQARLDRASFLIIEYLSASNWALVFNHLQSRLRTLRATPQSGRSRSISDAGTDLEASALAGLQIMAHLWINRRKLSVIIQELCGCFLNLQKAAQNAIAVLLPETIDRWIEKNPEQFVHLHVAEKRLDGGAEFLFDMSNSMADDIRLMEFLWPFQTSLLLLIPEVFWVASNIRDAKNGNVAKKASFLEGLRQSLHSSRSGNTAAFCLVRICKVAHYFTAESDVALLSYALDVQLEIREEVFKPTSSDDERPFDRHLMVAAVVSLCHLSLRSVLEHVIPCAFENESQLSLKLAVFHACAIISRQSDVARYQPLFAAVGPHARALLLSATSGSGTGIPGPTTRGGISPTPHPYQQNPRAYELMCTMFDFLALRPVTLFEGAAANALAYNESFNTGLIGLVPFIADDDERLRSLAARVVRNAVAESLTIWTGGSRDSGSDRFRLHQWWQTTSSVLSALAMKTLDLRLRGSEAKALVHAMDDFLKTRLEVVKIQKNLNITLDIGMDIPERSSASVNSEVAFLVLLCSSDLGVCAATQSCLAGFCEEGAMTEDLTDLARSPLTIMRNYEVYTELASPHFHLTGMVAFQKRYRRLLGKVLRPTAGILTAWEMVFSRWDFISGQILRSRPTPRAEMEEATLMEWRNYSGFLASLGGSCIADTPQAARADISMIAGLRWIDRLSSDSDGQTLLDRFMTQCIHLLNSTNVRAREATRDVLGTELSPRLYSRLFRALETHLTTIFESAGTASPTDPGIVFAEQAASLLRAIVERLEDVHEALVSADFGLLALDLARYVHGQRADPTTLRVKIKICQLCEALTCKRETLKIGHDIRVRNQLVALLLSWMSRPGTPTIDDSQLPAGVRIDAALRLQRDLDRACLRALVELTHGLPLQPSEGQSDADTSESKSALYHEYFNRLLSLLSHESSGSDHAHEALPTSFNADDASTTADLVITALSNLLSANIDVGLKQSLEIGYHPDRIVRTAFMRVLCNILNQEVEFERLSDTAINDKYNSLLQLFLHDMGLVVALCDSCPSSEVDEITISFLNIFESRGLGLVLLQGLVEHEVMNTDNESELLRRNCVATKMLTAYAKWKGASYLRSTIQQAIRRLLLASDELDLELDPVRTNSPDELQRNASQLRYITKTFIDDICKSADKVPPTFRRICHIIANAVTVRFPEAKYTAVGAFIFLRFFCPAIVAPEAEGLVSAVPTKEMRRGLLLIAKVVQNLANNILFGAKEPYMYPLNDFLTKNIYRVTAFLREISGPFSSSETEPALESFDFGSCAALHRFLFDNWEGVRQKIVVRERRSWKDAGVAAEVDAAPVPRLGPSDALGNLVALLGPPSVDISWNRPQISANVPPTYSRFQHFMLKNAGRNSDSVMSARVVYDGGLSKDDLPVICISLRNIEVEGIDHDLLLYCYLKIASRMWHRPFGILVDATCYNSLSEPQDELFQRLDALSPSEIAKNLSKIYVYNMNSAFRKCFRRVLRLAGKNESSSFHPSHVEYHLIGSLPELQTHFHLGPLHLPKDTMTVVSDARFSFHPVVRLSKTKGKIDVIIKVGAQFVQITTTKKQELVPGLRLNAAVNDIFRLAEVEEASTSIQTADNSSFGLRTENGKIVMYFTSARKTEILAAIKSAKARTVPGAKVITASERLIRPEDVPGTLINIALMNLASADRGLRLTAYSLLCSLGRAFHFDLSDHFVTAPELHIPAHSSAIVVGVSERLADSEPQLTSDFLSECFLAWDKLPPQQRPLHLLYMVPWLRNLRVHVLSPDSDGEKGRERVALIARKLILTALKDASLETCFQQSVWPVIARDEVLVDVFLDEMIRIALASGSAVERTEGIGSIAASLGTVLVQGKVIARLRKVLNRSSLRPTRHLPDNAVWSETCVLLRICVATSFDSRAQSQLFLPELFHIITSVVNTGSVGARSLVHNLLVNTIHSICTSFALDEVRRNKLKAVLSLLSETKAKKLFGLHPAVSAEGPSTQDFLDLDHATFTSLQAIVQLLLEIIAIGSPSADVANMWRSRWMSLVASTAFQSNPAIQPRAFAVMGCLAREDVDDDLLYQVLVSLRTTINGFGEDPDAELLIAIVTTLTKMMANVSASSRYLVQLFWLAISLVRLVPLPLFDCAASLLEAVLQAIAATGEFKGGRMAAVLLRGRQPIEEVTQEIDALYGVAFTAENFHYASTATLIKGLSDPTTKDTALRTLSSFLEISSASVPEDRRFPRDLAILPYLGLVTARATTVDEIREILWLTGLSPNIAIKSPADVFAMIDLAHVAEDELLLYGALNIVGFASCEDIVQQRTLTFLHRVATQRPSVLLQLYEPISSILDSVLLTSETAETLEAAHALTRSLATDMRFASSSSTAAAAAAAVATSHTGDQSGSSATSGPPRKLSDVLEEVGMEGIWKIIEDDGVGIGGGGTNGARRNGREMGDAADIGVDGGFGRGGILQRRCAVLVGRVIDLIIL